MNVSEQVGGSECGVHIVLQAISETTLVACSELHDCNLGRSIMQAILTDRVVEGDQERRAAFLS